MGLFCIYLRGTFAIFNDWKHPEGEEVFVWHLWKVLARYDRRYIEGDAFLVTSNMVLAVAIGPLLLYYAACTYVRATERHALGPACSLVLLYTQFLYYATELHTGFRNTHATEVSEASFVGFVILQIILLVLPVLVFVTEIRQVYYRVKLADSADRGNKNNNNNNNKNNNNRNSNNNNNNNNNNDDDKKKKKEKEKEKEKEKKEGNSVDEDNSVRPQRALKGSFTDVDSEGPLSDRGTHVSAMSQNSNFNANGNSNDNSRNKKNKIKGGAGIPHRTPLSGRRGNSNSLDSAGSRESAGGFTESSSLSQPTGGVRFAPMARHPAHLGNGELSEVGTPIRVLKSATRAPATDPGRYFQAPSQRAAEQAADVRHTPNSGYL